MKNQNQIERKNNARSEEAQSAGSTPRRRKLKSSQWGDDELYFFAEAIDAARNLPIQDALRFLRGMVKVCGDIEQVRNLRWVVWEMNRCDGHLDLLQIGLNPFMPETN